MPTLAELLTATQAKLDATEAQIATLRQKLADTAQQIEQAEKRRAVLKTRLEALDVLSKETP